MQYKLLIRKYRKKRNITQKELANKTGLGQSYISKLENNKLSKNHPTFTTMLSIAKVLDVCPHILVRYDYKCNNNCINICDKNF